MVYLYFVYIVHCILWWLDNFSQTTTTGMADSLFTDGSRCTEIFRSTVVHKSIPVSHSAVLKMFWADSYRGCERIVKAIHIGIVSRSHKNPLSCWKPGKESHHVQHTKLTFVQLIVNFVVSRASASLCFLLLLIISNNSSRIFRVFPRDARQTALTLSYPIFSVGGGGCYAIRDHTELYKYTNTIQIYK